METGFHELVILSYATVCLHPSVSLNNEKNCRAISKDKIAVCEKTASLRSGNSSDLDSAACLKALVPVEIFQFSNMHYESRFLDTFRGHNIRPRPISNLLDGTVDYILVIIRNESHYYISHVLYNCQMDNFAWSIELLITLSLEVGRTQKSVRYITDFLPSFLACIIAIWSVRPIH